MNILNKDFIRTSSDISDQILNIMDSQDEFSRGDLQGAIEAQVIRAIRYGYDLHEKDISKE